MNNKDELIFNEFRDRFPLMAKTVIDHYVSNREEITIIMSNGLNIVYDNFDKTIRSVIDYSSIGDGVMPEKTWRMRFAQNLYRRMTFAGYTQRELAEASGISQASLSKYLGMVSVPSSYATYRLAKVLDCSESDLIHFD